MGSLRFASIAIAALLVAVPATADSVNLNDKSGVPLRDDAPVRADSDYELLKEYRDRL